MSLKNPVTTPGIDPGTVRLVVQRLNHYATPGPTKYIYIYVCVCVCGGVMLYEGRAKICLLFCMGVELGRSY